MPVILLGWLLQIMNYVCVLGKNIFWKGCFFYSYENHRALVSGHSGRRYGPEGKDTSPGCASRSVISIHYCTSMMMRSKTKYLLLAPLNPRV